MAKQGGIKALFPSEVHFLFRQLMGQEMAQGVFKAFRLNYYILSTTSRSTE